MNRFKKWHVSVSEHPYRKARHYKHITSLYKFILRRPDYFSGKTLHIFSRDELVIKLTFEDVLRRTMIGLTEGPERKFIREWGKSRDEVTLTKCIWRKTELSVHEVNYLTSCENSYADNNIFLDVEEIKHCMFCGKEKEVLE